MKRSSSAVAIIALAASCLLSLPSSASSLKCAPPRSAKVEFDEATAVFQGKVIGEEERELSYTVGPFKYKKSQVFRFRVEQWWKGGNKEEAEVHVPLMEYDGRYYFPPESFIFKKEKRYLVYGYGAHDMLVTSVCTRTKNIERAQEDLNLLGKGQKPEP